ncbi:hypothetical protein [Roseiconus lacunae]|uniref:Uncharacterized protein n=1 Tax=Roseiconus lacunae TaxID=2605694 RepID=A0ABT7PD37_9BACT|nr:hypothetical protein [Roseiconus lacunae]MCD0459712.1 hypothetical protein [Roseiconus lacunae]MDM4014412.1 hypothetical protein [Roseiconus lacunae]WRQ49723.1 hypothetical protein U8335_22545 [Stieleria sp. HD01]
MNTTDAIHQRGHALEDLYFRHIDETLLQKMREKSQREQMTKELSDVAAIDDTELLDHMLDLDINASTIAAFTLTPLVFVAWADGSVTSGERQTVMSAALTRGVSDNPLAFMLLKQWLGTRPPRELWETWKEYASRLHQTLPAETADTLASKLENNARVVAEASGGVLGIGKTSNAEQKILNAIRETLPPRTEPIVRVDASD